MVNKTISITYELFNKLKEEKNASELICGLLNKYYETLGQTTNNPVIIEERIKELEDEKMKLTNKKVLIEKEIEVEEVTKQEKAADQEVLYKISNFCSNMTEEQKNEYLLGVKIKEWGGIVEYAKKKLGID